LGGAPRRWPKLALGGALICLLAMTACAGAPPAPSTTIAPGDLYVAMGSSFAAGPGVTHPAEDPSTRCARSADNYARQLARKRGLRLVDVSCSGATTAHVFGPWGALPPQVDALTSDTRLVTVTIGGNDLGYIAGLYAASCGKARPDARPTFCGDGPGAPVDAPSEAAWAKVETALDQIVHAVRARSPRARLVFVDYLTVLPPQALCARTPLAEDQAATARRTAQRLARVTALVAERGGAQVVRASDLSRGHDACAPAPFITGFVPPPGAGTFAPYHPNLEGMTAIAQDLDRTLGR
jgi:lysophospholipase L1-like esterase